MYKQRIKFDDDKHLSFDIKNQPSLIDKTDYHLLSDFPSELGRNGYIYLYINNKRFLLHRIITKCPKTKVVDHLNGIKLDNRKDNLRICSRLENNRNQINKNTNICVRKHRNSWVAEVSGEHLGHFKLKKDAIEAVLSKKHELGFMINGKPIDKSIIENKRLKKYSNKYRGATWNSDNNGWAARVNYNGKIIFLGYFKTRKMAALIAKNKREELDM